MALRKNTRTSFGNCLQRFEPTLHFESNIVQLPSGKVHRVTGISASFLVGDPARFADVFVGRIVILLGKADLTAFYDPLFSTPTVKDLTDEFPLLFDENYSVSINSGCHVNFDLGTGYECDASDTMTIIQTPLYGTTGFATPGVGFIQGGTARLNVSGISFDPNMPEKQRRLR